MTSSTLQNTGIDTAKFEAFVAKLAKKYEKQGRENPEQDARSFASYYEHHFRQYA